MCNDELKKFEFHSKFGEKFVNFSFFEVLTTYIIVLRDLRLKFGKFFTQKNQKNE